MPVSGTFKNQSLRSIPGPRQKIGVFSCQLPPQRVHDASGHPRSRLDSSDDRSFLKKPDSISISYEHRWPCKVYLFKTELVIAAEMSDTFARRKEQAEIRRQKKMEIDNRRREETLKKIEDLPAPEVPTFTNEELRRNARAHWRSLYDPTDRKSIAPHYPDANYSSFIETNIVNYLRHQCTPTTADVRAAWQSRCGSGSF